MTYIQFRQKINFILKIIWNMKNKNKNRIDIHAAACA